MNFDQHILIGALLIVAIYFIYPNWLGSSIIMILIGSFIPDVLEPSKRSYKHSSIVKLLSNVLPLKKIKFRTGAKHRGFFHSWYLLRILVVVLIVSFLITLFYFPASWIFYFCLGYLFHLLSDAISNIYNSKQYAKKDKYYPDFGLPLK